MAFTVIIPARYASTRLPGKPLADIAGKSMIQRVYLQAVASGAEQVIIATDDERVAEHARSFGAMVCMTDPKHNSGTERLSEVIDKLQLAADTIIVNVQGDEPFIPPTIIRQVADNLAVQQKADMATLAVALSAASDVANPNIVKVVTDKAGYALYFSRSVIPYDRDGRYQQQLSQHYQRHIGIYAYRAAFIKRYINWPVSELEQIESLEQLRVLWHGESIHVAIAAQVPAHGVDTPADLDAARVHALSQL